MPSLEGDACALAAVPSARGWTRCLANAICRRCSTDEIETDFHRIWSCPANRNIYGIEKSQHLLMKHAATGSRAQCFGFEDAFLQLGSNPLTSRNLRWMRSMGHGHTIPPRCTLLPAFMGQEMAQGGSNQKTHGIGDVGMVLSWSTLGGV